MIGGESIGIRLQIFKSKAGDLVEAAQHCGVTPFVAVRFYGVTFYLWPLLFWMIHRFISSFLFGL